MLPVKYALYFKSSSAEAFPLGTSFGVLKLNPQEVVLEAKVKLEIPHTHNATNIIKAKSIFFSCNYIIHLITLLKYINKIRKY